MAGGRNVISQSIRLEGGEEILRQLRSLGEEGERSAQRLQQAFGRVALGNNFAAQFARLRTSFAGVVEFEPSPIVTTNGDVIRNARRLLDFGDVRGAIEALTGVKGMASEAFRTWRIEAVKRAALDESLRGLNARLLGAAVNGATAG